MNNIFTICYSEEEANEIGHFIMRKGYEGVQNDSYRYCREAIRWAFRQAKRHHSNCIYIGVRGCQMIVSKNKRRLRRNRLKYIEKKRIFYNLLSSYSERMAKMTKEKCIVCGKETVSVIKTDAGYICYNCYAEQKNPSKRKRKKNNEEERMQCKFFEEVEKIFPKLPNKLLFAVPNGGSRHIREAANLKRQGVTSGVSDVILLIPKKGYASLCIEFKTKKGIQSEEQKEFQRQAENCRNKYVIARSVKQGIDALKEYLL